MHSQLDHPQLAREPRKIAIVHIELMDMPHGSVRRVYSSNQYQTPHSRLGNNWVRVTQTRNTTHMVQNPFIPTLCQHCA
jgi:hypothetical protein